MKINCETEYIIHLEFTLDDLVEQQDVFIDQLIMMVASAKQDMTLIVSNNQENINSTHIKTLVDYLGLVIMQSNLKSLIFVYPSSFDIRSINDSKLISIWNQRTTLEEAYLFAKSKVYSNVRQ